MNGAKWTEAEDQIIIDNYLEMTDEQLKELLPHRTVSAISGERKKLRCMRDKSKYSYDYFVDSVVKNNCVMLSERNEYVNSNTRMRILCPKHGERLVSLTHWIDDGGCVKCKRGDVTRKHKDDERRKRDIELCKQKNVEYIDCHRQISSTGSMRIYVDFICDKHKEYGVQTVYRNNIGRVKTLCKYCSPNPKLNCDEIKQLLCEHSDDFEFMFDDNLIMSGKVLCRCKKHDYFSEIRVKAILSGAGCIKCQYEKISQSVKLTEEQIAEKVNSSSSNVEYVGGYRHAHERINVRCKKCNIIYDTYPNHIRKCPNCETYYNGEIMTSEYLKCRNVYYMTQYSFEDCVYKSRLKFDFYLPDCNTCIEYNGRQHYEPVEIFGGEQRFEDQQIRDNIKRQYCQNNGIKLIEIPYTYDTEDKIKQYLDERL